MKIKKKRDALLSQKTIMRKIHLLLALFLFTFSFSQIKVLKNENLVEVGKEKAIALYKKQNKYVFNYQDINNSNLNTYRSFYFHDLNKDFDQLYKMISDGFIDMPQSEIQLELPNDIIGLNFAKNYGQTTVQFVHYINKSKKHIGKSQFLTKNQVDKVFGKNRMKNRSSVAASKARTTIQPYEKTDTATEKSATKKK